MSITILLVDDHPVFRKGLHLFLQQEEDMRVIGEAGDGRTAIERVRELSPDVVVMDITMPNFNGIEATRQIVSESPGTKILAMSIHSGKRFVEDMLAAGAAGYILKLSAPEELVAGIRAIVRGDVYLSADITGIVVNQYLKVLAGDQENGQSTELTPRESEILQMLAEGQSTTKIAEEMEIGQEMVQSLQQRLMEKLDIHDAAQISEAATQMGLMGEVGASAPAHPVEALPILLTKLNTPPPPLDVVPRAHLVAKLDEIFSRPLTLVSAAAGYGKSTMASLWLKAWGGPYGWVSLDEMENDLHLFLCYLLTAIQNAIPGACQKTQSLIQASQLPPLSVLSRYLQNDLDEIKTPFILVLDDFHKIDEKAVLDLMTAILTYPPRNLHLMLLARRDPFLITRSLRARGQVNEIGASELMFTTAETMIFLKNATGISVDEKTAARIQDKIEGWPSGIRLMSQSLKYPDDINRLLSGLKGGFAVIVGYLMTQALSRIPQKMTRLLYATAIPDRFCEPLCNAFLKPDVRTSKGEVDGFALINRLQKENLFLVALDTENRWFRYHHLFRNLLRSHLKKRYSTAEITAHHLRASEWFARNDLIDEALKHAIAANDIDFAVTLVEQHHDDLFNAEQWGRLNRWVQLFPPEVVAKRPLLLTMKAFYLESCGRVAELYATLDRIEPLLSTIPPDSAAYDQVHGEYYALLTERQFFSFEPESTIASYQKAVKLLPPKARVSKCIAAIFGALSFVVRGNPDKSLCAFYDTLDQPSMYQTTDPGMLHRCLCFHHSFLGDLSSVESHAMRAIALSKGREVPVNQRLDFYFLGTLNYWRNNLSEAAAYLEVFLENKYIVRPVYYAISAYLKALIHLSRGQGEEAKSIIESVTAFGRESDNGAVIELGRAFEVEMALRQARTSDVPRLMKGVDFNWLPPIWFDYFPQLTSVKSLIAMDSPENDQEASRQLDKWSEFGRSTHNTKFLIEVLALQAILSRKQGKGSSALKKMREALELAEPGGFIRTFVDLGPPATDLLERLRKQNFCVEYVGKILDAFRVEFHGVAPEESVKNSQPVPPYTPQPLVEPLTDRELDVLELLARRLQTKEIADKLSVASGTVKTHLKHIYQKLDATKRQQAVEKARKLGII